MNYSIHLENGRALTRPLRSGSAGIATNGPGRGVRMTLFLKLELTGYSGRTKRLDARAFIAIWLKVGILSIDLGGNMIFILGREYNLYIKHISVLLWGGL